MQHQVISAIVLSEKSLGWDWLSGVSYFDFLLQMSRSIWRNCVLQLLLGFLSALTSEFVIFCGVQNPYAGATFLQFCLSPLYRFVALSLAKRSGHSIPSSVMGFHVRLRRRQLLLLVSSVAGKNVISPFYFAFSARSVCYQGQYFTFTTSK